MAGSTGLGPSVRRHGVSLSVRVAERAVIQSRPVQGNSPSDRKDYPDFKSPQENLRPCPPTRSLTRTAVRLGCAPDDEPGALSLAFLGMAESIGPIWPIPSNLGPGAASRWSAPGPVKRTLREEPRAPGSSSAMSSGRLFLDGLLASIARLRFTGMIRIKLLPKKRE